MKTALRTVIDTIKAKADFNLSNEERGSLSSLGDDRLPYVYRSINDHGTNYPDLNGLAQDLADAEADLDTFGNMDELLSIASEVRERAEELQQVAGHFCYKFMRDQYANAERYRTENVAGAQVVYDDLKGAFEGQGPKNQSSSNTDTNGDPLP